MNKYYRDSRIKYYQNNKKKIKAKEKERYQKKRINQAKKISEEYNNDLFKYLVRKITN